jgi:hypothetical protein
MVNIKTEDTAMRIRGATFPVSMISPKLILGHRTKVLSRSL